MKKTLLFIIIGLFISSINAQTPNSFKYQTVVRDAAGYVMANHNVSFQISIVQGSAGGSSIYTESFDAITTNSFGLVNLSIGEGVTTDDFLSINWESGPYFIKVEIDADGGTTYTEMGTSQLLAVPYAMYAQNVANKDDADADPNNEFQTIQKTGSTVTLSNAGGSFTDEVNDGDYSATNELQILNFSNDTLYLDNGGQVFLGNYQSLWGQNDTNIYYNNGWVGVGTSTPSGMMVVQGDNGVNPDSAIFEVKNKNGQTIFAVYDGGVRIWVDDTGLKANTDKGGFAVGGYRTNKTLSNEYLRVTPDSVRVYIREDDGTKANTDKGGFAVGGYRTNKTLAGQYFQIDPNDTASTLNPSEPRIFWYPLKEAFLSGRVLVEHPDSVGTNSWASGFESKSIGDYSQALGYRARARGENSTAIGYYANADSINSYAFGNYALAQDSGSYAIGTGAQATGLRSFAIGSIGVDSTGNSTTPTLASGEYSYAFGMGSVASNKGSFAFGTLDTASGIYSLSMGYESISSGYYSTAIGYRTKSSGLFSLAMGSNSIANQTGAVAIGTEVKATGAYSTAFGSRTNATGTTSTAMGDLTTASGYSSTAMGRLSVASNFYSIAAGRGCTSSGVSAIAMGAYAEAIGDQSISLGNYSIAEGENSVAMGDHSEANGDISFAVGSSVTADGWASTAMGTNTKATGGASFAAGNSSISRGVVSSSFGYATIAKSYTEFVVGALNDTTLSSNESSWTLTDPLFIIGNGVSTRHNAFVVYKNGQADLNTDNSTKGFNVTHNTNNSGTSYGIKVYSNNTYSGNSSNYGVYSYSKNDNGSYSTYGVYGYATGSSTGSKYGVFGSGYGTGSETVYGVRGYAGGGTGTRYAVYAAGDLAYTGALISVSDVKFKENINDLDNILPKLMQIKTRSFTFKKDEHFETMSFPEGTQFGVIAQELEKVFPELVKNGAHSVPNKDGQETEEIKYKSVKYIELVPIAIKAIQEQQNVIQELNQENENLKQENLEIKKRLERLEKLILEK